MALSSKEYLPVVASDGFGDEKIKPPCNWDDSIKVGWTKRSVFLQIAVLAGGILLGFAASRFLSSHPAAPVWNTDFAPTREAVELERVRFTSSPSFDDKGKPILSFAKNQTRYTGLPVEEVDAAWDNLIGIRYFLISDQEALEAWGPSYKQYYRYPNLPGHEGGYVAGLDTLHTLHCVNQLRKALYKDHYPAEESTDHDFKQYHIDHCIEILRQSVQCGGDLTPIPTNWWPGLWTNGSNFINTDQVHTCRNFSKIRQWTLKRWNAHHRMGKGHLPPAPEDVLS